MGTAMRLEWKLLSQAVGQWISELHLMQMIQQFHAAAIEGDALLFLSVGSLLSWLAESGTWSQVHMGQALTLSSGFLYMGQTLWVPSKSMSRDWHIPLVKLISPVLNSWNGVDFSSQRRVSLSSLITERPQAASLDAFSSGAGWIPYCCGSLTPIWSLSAWSKVESVHVLVNLLACNSTG